MGMMVRTYSKEDLPSFEYYGVRYSVNSCNVRRARTAIFRGQDYYYRL
jgi:hypothetical protein